MALIQMGRDLTDPLTEFERLQNEINSLFDFTRETPVHGLFDRAVSPAVDVVETVDEFLVLCDLPGVKLSDLDISIANGVLTVKGEKKPLPDMEGAKVYKRETWEGNFQRTLSMPDSIDSTKIEAVFESGVLKVRLPKKEEMKPRQIQIQAK